jgi:FkbM family methyltransferase
MPGWARAWSRPKNGAFVPRVAKYIFRTHSFEFYVADKVSQDWYASPNRSTPEHEWCADRIETGWTIVDCGCHHGMTSVMFALSTGPTGRIFAFDALPQNAAITKHNARLNRLSNIIVRPVGLGEHPGPKWASFQNGNSVVTRNAREDAVEIELSRLDDEIPADIHVDFLKIDVEGHELEVLRGARRVLSGRPVIDLELHNFIHHGIPLQEIRQTLMDLDYCFYVQETPHDIPRGPFLDLDFVDVSARSNPHILCVSRLAT